MDIVKKLFNKVKQPYLFCSIILSILFLSALLIIVFYYDYISISRDSALYLMSAMAQVLAAILAIVIGFSFVAFQLSAQVGSPRIIDSILKDKSIWSLLFLYGFSILYDLLILRILPEENTDVIPTYFIDIGIILTFISFISLFPYSYYMIERIKPEKIIQGIIKHNEFEQNGDVEQLKRDIILPIVDIMNKAIDANDPHTLKVGLDELEKLNVDIVKSKINKSEYKLEIVKYYSGKINRLVENAFNQNDEDSVIEITDSIKNIGIISIKMRWSEVPPDEKERIKGDVKYRNGIGFPDKTDDYDAIASKIQIVLSDASIKAIRKNWSRATSSLLNARMDIIVTSHEELVLNIMYDTSRISNDFLSLSDKDKLFSMDYFIEAIRNTLLNLINKNMYFNEWYYTNTIKTIIENSLEVINKDECYKISRISDYIVDIGIEAAKRDYKLKDDLKKILIEISTYEKCQVTPIFEIGNRGFGLALNSQKFETAWVCSCLKEIGSLCLQKKMDETAYHVFDFLEGIENNYRQTRLNDVEEVTKKIIDIIEELGKKSIIVENDSVVEVLEKSFREAMNSLIKIGMKNENITIKTRVCKTLKDMQGKMENKEIFKSIMELNEQSQGYELTKFQEFRKFCDFDAY